MLLLSLPQLRISMFKRKFRMFNAQTLTETPTLTANAPPVKVDIT